MTAPRFAPTMAPPRQRPDPRPAPEPPRRALPPLRVVPDPAILRTRRLARLCTALAGLVACFGLFGVVGVHVMLAQGQGDVQRLQSEVDDQEAAQQRLQLQVAELQSPERIVAAAKEQLGMTTPTPVVVLSGATLADPPAITIPAPRPTTTTPATPATTTPSTATAGAASATSRP